MNLDNDQTPLRVAGVPGIGPTKSPLGGYPDNPSTNYVVDHRPGAGIPEDVNTFAQGIEVLETCTNCGRAFRPFEMGGHNQQEGIYDGSRFGEREFQV